MRMFSKSILAAAVLSLPFVLVACSDDDDGNDNDDMNAGVGGLGSDDDDGMMMPNEPTKEVNFDLIDEDGDGTPDGIDINGDGKIDIRGVPIDSNDDGEFDGLDTNGDGEIDISFEEEKVEVCQYLESDGLFCVSDCTAAEGPTSLVKDSGVGAFADDSDWMDGWTNWSIDSSGVTEDDPTDWLEEDIDADTTLTADKVWGLRGTIHVLDGVTLTIEAGAVIKGDSFSKGALVVSRGGKINAVGTAEEPIVFTSLAGEGDKAKGQWGGLILLGKAPNFNGENVDIEGLPSDVLNQYGGTEADDNSGELKYVRIEFGGIELAPDKEINGLTLGSIGSGTKISYVQVNTTLDDGIEWFGGGADADHLVVNNAGDDMFDIDQGFQGAVSTIFGRQVVPSTDDPNGFEWDSDQKDGEAGVGRLPVTTVSLEKATLCGTGEFGEPNYGMVLRENIRATIDNLAMIGFDAGVDTRDDFLVGDSSVPKVEITNSVSWAMLDGISLHVEETGDDDDDAGFDEGAWFQGGTDNKDLDE